MEYQKMRNEGKKNYQNISKTHRKENKSNLRDEY